MKRYLILPVLAFIGGIFFAAATYSSANDTPTSAGAPPPIVAGQSAVDKVNCSDGAIALWKGDNVITYQIVSDSHADWVDVEMAREGVNSWNNQGGPYILVETPHTNKRETDIGIVVYGGESDASPALGGVTFLQCSSGATGITEAVEIIVTELVPSIGTEVLTAHETGHALGLGHSNDPRDLMYPIVPTVNRNVCPSNLDLNGLNSNTDPTSVASSTWTERPTC